MSVGKKTNTKSIEEIRLQKLEQRIEAIEQLVKDLLVSKAVSQNRILHTKQWDGSIDDIKHVLGEGLGEGI